MRGDLSRGYSQLHLSSMRISRPPRISSLISAAHHSGRCIQFTPPATRFKRGREAFRALGPKASSSPGHPNRSAYLQFRCNHAYDGPGLHSLHQMAFGALLPIYPLDPPSFPTHPRAGGRLDLYGGFGLTIHDVGVYTAVNRIIALFIQAFIFPVFVQRVGVWHSFLVTVTLYPLAYVMMPFLSSAVGFRTRMAPSAGNLFCDVSPGLLWYHLGALHPHSAEKCHAVSLGLGQGEWICNECYMCSPHRQPTSCGYHLFPDR